MLILSYALLISEIEKCVNIYLKVLSAYIQNALYNFKK